MQCRLATSFQRASDAVRACQKDFVMVMGNFMPGWRHHCSLVNTSQAADA
jgi:hypothetical protein